MSWRKFDLWVGRHMNSTRWIAVWSLVAIGGAILCVFGSWRIGLGVPLIYTGVVMVWGNVRRWR